MASQNVFQESQLIYNSLWLTSVNGVLKPIFARVSVCVCAYKQIRLDVSVCGPSSAINILLLCITDELLSSTGSLMDVLLDSSNVMSVNGAVQIWWIAYVKLWNRRERFMLGLKLNLGHQWDRRKCPY